MKSLLPNSSSVARIWLPLLILIVFGIFYGSITFVNHANYRTYAFDLAYYNHTVYDFSQLRLGEHRLENSIYWHTFGDHFEPILILLSPLMHFFGNYTLLIVQWAAILLGGIGVYRYFAYKSDDIWTPPLAMAQFFSIWGSTSALGFDFHSSVLGAMVVPWMLLYLEKSDKWRFGIALLLLLSTGEKVAFWAAFILVGWTLLNLRNVRKWIPAAIGAVFSILWMMVSLKFVIPIFLKPGTKYQHFQFLSFGNNLPEVFQSILHHPVDAFLKLFQNHNAHEPDAKHLKVELWKMILLSGGIGLLRRPQYFLMLLPILLTKLWNDNSVRWGINAHYSIEFVPILCIAIFHWISDIRLTIWRRVAAFLVFALTLLSLIVSLSTRYEMHFNKDNIQVFNEKHWKRLEYDPYVMDYAVSIVPPHVPVSASDRIASHITPREKIYLFPTLGDAEYAVICLIADTYPLSQDRTFEVYQDMLHRGEWQEVWRCRSVGVLKRCPMP